MLTPEPVVEGMKGSAIDKCILDAASHWSNCSDNLDVDTCFHLSRAINEDRSLHSRQYLMIYSETPNSKIAHIVSR